MIGKGGEIMIMFWSALTVSTLSSIFVWFQIPDVNGWDIVWIILFFIGSLGTALEIFKWPLGRKKIDNSKGLAKHIFGGTAGSWWDPPRVFPAESVISAQENGRYSVWLFFINNLFFMVLTLANLFEFA
jgi:hypothetical protein